MSGTDVYLIDALRRRDSLQSLDDPISQVVMDCTRAVHTAVAARKRAAALASELQLHQSRDGSASPSASSPAASATASREIAQLKDRLIAL